MFRVIVINGLGLALGLALGVGFGVRVLELGFRARVGSITTRNIPARKPEYKSYLSIIILHKAQIPESAK